MRNLACLVLAALLLFAFGEKTVAEPLRLTVDRLNSFTIFKQQKTFGPLEWRGGLSLSSENSKFGGLSGLAMSSDGAKLMAVSDAGYWFRAEAVYEQGELAGLTAPEIASVVGPDGKRLHGKFLNDAEALAGWTLGDLGRVVVAFESKTRAGIFDLSEQGLSAPMQPLKLPEAIADGPNNSEIEALGRFADGPLKGSMLAISELNLDAAGDIRAWVFGGKRKFDFTIKRFGDYAITDLAILPDGDIVVLERSFEGLLPGMALRLIRTDDIVAGGAVAPELLFEAHAPFHAIDNMEGIAVSRSPDGETRLTLVSDDNFNHRLQRTLILQFALKLDKLVN